MERLALAAMLASASTLVRATPCPTAGTQTVASATVEDRLELKLPDGRRLRLVGLDPASPTPDDPDRGDKARLALARLVAGRALSVNILAKEPDRWGRLAAFAFRLSDAASDAIPGGLAGAALAEGDGRVLDEPAAHACHDTLLVSEAKARQDRLGLWADPYYAVLPADDGAAFGERSATIILAEGRVRAVESGPFRTKLRFVARDGRWRETLTAIVLPRTMKTFEGQGVKVRSLIGKTLRIRGLLDLRFGPQIELSSLDQIEFVDAPAAAAGAN